MSSSRQSRPVKVPVPFFYHTMQNSRSNTMAIVVFIICSELIATVRRLCLLLHTGYCCTFCGSDSWRVQMMDLLQKTLYNFG